MSSIQTDASQPSLPSPAPSDEDLPATLSSDDGGQRRTSNAADTGQPGGFPAVLLDAFKDARQIIRLIQCQLCHKILQNPTTLPCGFSICRACLPETRPRANITWPATASRLQGFDCPLPGCDKEHAAVDCAPDVTLNKVLDVIKTAVAEFQSPTELSKCSTHIAVRDLWGVAGIPSMEEKKQSESRVLDGGRIFATYSLVELGKLDYNSEVSYSPVGASADQVSGRDSEIFLKLKEAARAEMDCQVCFALFLDPITTPCGHTYCRSCVHRILDHSDLCPICRRVISIQAQVDPRAAPSNGRLVSMIDGFWADLVALRQQAYQLEQQANYDGFDVPLFVCTLSFPSMPLFLHVFEPRYRLMIRRVMDSSNRTFGMVLGRPSPGPGDPPFMELGVLLRIVSIEFFPDGRSLLETVGVSRFKVTRHGLLDGYIVANIEKMDDISLADEEALEASELGCGSEATTSEVHVSTPGSSDAESPSVTELTPAAILARRLESTSTRDMADFGVSFVRRMRQESVYWLAARMLTLYGECPDDPATFPWWLACVFPVSDAEKYRLLSTSSVRERLKICYRWIVEWENSRWNLANCQVM